MHEKILIFRKGSVVHRKDPKSKIIIDEITKKDISNSLWNIVPVPPKFIDHPCPFPEEIPFRLIRLYSNVRDLVLDPFVGSGQTTKAAKFLKRRFIGIDVVQEYVDLARKRLDEPIHLRDQLVPKWQKIPRSE